MPITVALWSLAVWLTPTSGGGGGADGGHVWDGDGGGGDGGGGAETELPKKGEVWVKRKTGERFEVWDAYPRWVVVYPLRAGNRRPIHVITNNFFQEFVPGRDSPDRLSH